MKIFFDVDGVLFNVYPKIEQMALFHFADMGIKTPLWDNYDMVGTDPIVVKYIKKQFTNPEIMVPADMFQPICLEINNLCKKHKVFIMTSRKMHRKELAYEAYKSFPDLTGIIFVGDVKNKWIWCESMGVDILVEDCWECIEKVMDYTTTNCIVVQQIHNKQFMSSPYDSHSLKWVDNIHGAVDLIKGGFGEIR